MSKTAPPLKVADMSEEDQAEIMAMIRALQSLTMLKGLRYYWSGKYWLRVDDKKANEEPVREEALPTDQA